MTLNGSSTTQSPNEQAATEQEGLATSDGCFEKDPSQEKSAPAATQPEMSSEMGDAQTADQAEEEASELESNPLLDAMQAKVDEMKDQYLRLRAEMENLRKRHQRELQNAHKFANEKILLDLLPVKDSLDLGVEAASKSLDESQQGVLEGIELIQQMLMQVLGRHQIEEIKPLGEKFNPEFHDAVAMANSDRYPSDIVMDVIQSGYQLNGRVTRPARVVVSRGPINPPTEEEI